MFKVDCLNLVVVSCRMTFGRRPTHQTKGITVSQEKAGDPYPLRNLLTTLEAQ